jgi:hypothetical protein
MSCRKDEFEIVDTVESRELFICSSSGILVSANSLDAAVMEVDGFSSIGDRMGFSNKLLLDVFDCENVEGRFDQM